MPDAPAIAEPSTPLTLVSWNLDGLDDRALDVRAEAACLALLLREAPPHVVLLQEVVDRSLAAHIRPYFVNSGYAAAIQPASGHYFCALFVRPPWRLVAASCHPFPGSAQGRALLEAEIALGAHHVRVGTAHLESGREVGAERIRQAAYVVGRLRAWPGPALFGGDTNLRRAEVASIDRVDQVRDAWEMAGAPASHQTTWYPQGQPRRRTVGARFDRVWLNGHPGWRVHGFATHGAEALAEADGMRPSDHLGLEVDLTL